MSKKLFLSIVGAIVLAMTFTACSTNNGKGSFLNTTTIDVDGKSYSVDKSILEHYTETHVKQALKRADVQKDIMRPADASTFGAKKAEVEWCAFEEDLKADKFAKKVGTVTVVHYEDGLEIIKDGQSWFYDGFSYREENIRSISASLAILDSPRWEPAKIKLTDLGVEYEYLYLKNYNGWERWIMVSYAREYFGIRDKDDIILSRKKY